MSDKPLVISCKVANTGITIMKIHVDTGSSIDLIYEQCFRQLLECIKADLQATAISLSGFAGESVWPMGQLSLNIELRDEADVKLTRQAQLDFYVISSAPRYNMLLGRSVLRKLGIVPSMIHGMIKFNTCKGVATINSMAMQSIRAAISTQDAAVAHKIIEDNMVVINFRYPDQKIKIGTELDEEIRTKIVQMLVVYMDVFAWSEQDTAGIPHDDTEHRLNANLALRPIVQKRRGMAHDRMKWLYAAKGYHQIPMAQEDEDKTAFHTGKGIYCYIKMPFGFKNAEATYQRLIDKAFEGQIGCNLEAYVDDLVIKSKTQEQILFDMEETFESLHKINMKLNPSKCSFGEREGKFPGYYVTEQGIQANPKKITAIENMTVPKTVKEVQSLIGKITALTRFLSKAVERQLPFFRTLKGCSEQKNFVWTEEADKAFQEMKQLLATLPTLIAPILSGHPIHALTDLSVKQVLSTPAVSGRLAKWAIEFGVFEITYLLRTSVKGQVLAYYLAKMSGELEGIHERTQLKPLQHEIWDLYTDGAWCIEGAALLAGLNVARKMNISQLRAYVNSYLVANQFNGSFEAHELSMQKYLKLLQEATEKFEFFELSQVSRSQNKKADALSKLAALTFLHFQKQVWVEELPHKSIDGSLFVVAIEEVQPNWMDSIMHYLRNNTLPEDNKEARLVQERSPMYVIENDMLYRKSYLGPLMRCVGLAKAATILEEVHSGSCALHSGYKTIAAKIM
ncbi:uncharacterized protein [Rutidosis leptorrhynchoides]|uniref:uncharacterized protein n=1 Tax=Rutidosis leptorrhynchoides TaxID=125765 RepID=UPI003A99F9D4